MRCWVLFFFSSLFQSTVLCKEFFLKDEALAKEFEEYVESLSPFKPLKCNSAATVTQNKDSLPEVWIQTRACVLNEMWIPFEFTGSVNELHQLSGPGKFTLQKDDSYLHKGNFSTCIDFPKIFDDNSRILSIIGTFVNGTLAGNAKVTFDSGFISILSFQNGIPQGLERKFDYQKNLMVAQILSDGFPVGLTLKRLSADIFLFDYRHTNDTIREAKTDLYSTLIFDRASHKFFGGTFPRYVENIYDLYWPKDLKLSHESNDCIKDITWEKTNSSEDNVYSLKNLDIVPKSLEDFFKDTSDLSAPQRLKRFTKYLAANKTVISHSFRGLVGPVNEESKLFLLTNITRTQGHMSYEGVLLGEKVTFRHHKGLLDENEEFHGNTWLRFDPWNQTIDKVTNTTIQFLALQFSHGRLLDGPIVLALSDTRQGHGHLVSGCLHGPLTIGGAVPTLPFKILKRLVVQETGATVLMYDSGHRESPFWMGTYGLGALTGMLNETGYISGEAIAYVYPDMETSYVGHFENKIMREAYLGDVVSVSWSRGGLVPRLSFKMSEEEKRPFYYEPPSNHSIGAGPRILDPYDAKRVFLSDAGEFGEGVISKVDMEVGDIVCLYNYHIYYPQDRKAYATSCTMNYSRTNEERRHCVKYSLAIQSLDATLNIPPEKDTPDMFLPTLGMKLNHKFYESHASFMDFESPRWGIVSSIALYFKPVKAGEQIFVDYGYRVRGEFPSDFLWFWELKDSVDAEIKAKKMAELKKKNKKKNRKSKKVSN